MMIVEISYEKRVDNRRSPTYITASIKVSRLQPGLLWQHIVLIVSLISWILGGFEWVHRTVNIARNTVGSAWKQMTVGDSYLLPSHVAYGGVRVRLDNMNS
jgi:hypothetical protein